MTEPTRTECPYGCGGVLGHRDSPSCDRPLVRDNWIAKAKRSTRRWMRKNDARNTLAARLLDRLDAAREVLRRLTRRPR